ncbi:uncharacterized protein [Chamaea fasciata]|uniref:uncharacterized protein n=1 Tax=Chamaea fasciata TaxID=190680 RepID=UPI003369E720
MLLHCGETSIHSRSKSSTRIRVDSKHPSAARGRLGVQSNVDRTRRSAGMEPPRDRSSVSSTSSGRRRFPRFIRSYQDCQAVFEEHRKRMEAQLNQLRWGRGSITVVNVNANVNANPRVSPRLLGAKEPPQCLGVEVARPDVNKVTEEDKRKNIRHCSSNSSTELERRRSMEIARLLPRLVVIVNPSAFESSSSSSSSSSSNSRSRSSSSSVGLESSTSTAAGRFFGQLRARLWRHLEARQTRHAQHRRSFRIRFKSQWCRRCLARLRKRAQ